MTERAKSAQKARFSRIRIRHGPRKKFLKSWRELVLAGIENVSSRRVARFEAHIEPRIEQVGPR